MTFLACKVTFKIMLLRKSYIKLATKIYDLATKFLPLVASWHLGKKVHFEPCRKKIAILAPTTRFATKTKLANAITTDENGPIVV